MPEWVKPTQVIVEPVLKVYNSLTRTKVSTALHGINPNVRKSSSRPKDGKSTGTTADRLFTTRRTWAMPGESSSPLHLVADGSNYLTQDIVRRILRDYFGYDVNFVMNITDIDDKVSL